MEYTLATCPIFWDHLKHPVREAAGVVWVWLGKGEPARFPEFEFNNLPADQTYVVKQVLECNWVQDLEGGLDSSHLGVLHQSWLKGLGSIQLATEDSAPHYEFVDQPGGYRYVAIRKLKDGNRYIRANHFVMPWYAFICPEHVPDGDRLVIFSTPIDDTHAVHWMLRYNPFRPIGPSYCNPAADPENWPPSPPGTADENWGQDRVMMALGHFTGFRHLNTEDFAVAVSQGPIVDRTKEHLAAGDRSVVRLRKMLLDSVREFQKGKKPKLARHEKIPYPKIRAVGGVLQPKDDWRTALV